MTKIACISDTHLQHKKLIIPKCDLLLCSGDIDTFNNIKSHNLAPLKHFNDWCGKLLDDGIVNDDVICIAGNHDVLAQTKPAMWRGVLQDCTYLQDELVERCGLKIYGTPWQPTFHDWAFNANRGEDIKQHWDKIPECDVLIVHGPPGETQDYLPNGDHVGCMDLRKRILELGTIKLVVCGHIHFAFGECMLGNTRIVNAAMCGKDHTLERYQPVVVEL